MLHQGLSSKPPLRSRSARRHVAQPTKPQAASHCLCPVRKGIQCSTWTGQLAASRSPSKFRSYIATTLLTLHAQGTFDLRKVHARTSRFQRQVADSQRKGRIKMYGKRACQGLRGRPSVHVVSKSAARQLLPRSRLLMWSLVLRKIRNLESGQPEVFRLLLDRLARIGCGLAPPPLTGPLLLPVEPVMAPCARVAAPVAWPVLGPLLGQPGLPGPTDLVLVETPVAPPVLLPLGWAWGWRRRM